MKMACRHLGKLAAAALVVAGALLPSRPAQAQTVTFPEWINDSLTVSNQYLRIWEYWRDGQETRFNIWTEVGDPFNDADNPPPGGFFRTIDANGNITIVSPWGSRLWSGRRPSQTDDSRPFANVLTLHVDDPNSTTGFTDFLIPDDGTPQFPADRIVPLADGQGFGAPYFIGAPGTPINLLVNQKVKFARDMVRVEIAIQNQGTATRRVGVRMLLDPYVDLWGPTRSAFIPETRERVFFEKEYRGGQVPNEWEIYNHDEIPNPAWVAKQILRGNGATTPARLILGNVLDMYPFVLGNATYDWTVRPDFELRIADIGALLYWDPITIPANSTRSVVTYIGMGVASHGMSDVYVASQAQPTISDVSQGFISAVQTPFALPLVNGDADTTESEVHPFIQNQFPFSVPGAFAFIDLPDGLEFSTNGPLQSARKDFGGLNRVGTTGDENQQDPWIVQPNGIDAGMLPVTVTFGNGLSDTARVIRRVNVPQGRRYQFTDAWKMVTFPFTFNALQDDPADVFKELDGVTPLTPGSFQVVRYNPQINAYENVSQIQAGKGYWVRMLGVGTTDVRLGSQSTPVKLGTRDIFTSGMQTGWNQVGNPSPYTVPVRELRFLGTGGVIISYDTAVAANIIRPNIFQYNYKTGQYELLGRDSLVKPGQGIWMYANAERSIVWPAPQGVGLSVTP